MVPANSVLPLVTLLLNSNIFNNFSNHEVTNTQYSNIFIKRITASGIKFQPIESNEIVKKSDFFPKCCPPYYLYNVGTRDCSQDETITSIYDDLNMTVGAVKSGLNECEVIIDRYVLKENFTRLEGNGSLVVPNEFYPSGQFCLDKIASDDFYVIRLCQTRNYCVDGNGTSLRDWCIPKCCSDGLTNTRTSCIYDGSAYGLDLERNKEYYEKEIDNYVLFFGRRQKCQGIVAEFREKNVTFKSDASLWIDGTKYNITEYCVDTFHNPGLIQSTTVVHICGNGNFLMKWTARKITVTLSCLSYVVILAVYIFIYKLKKLVEKIIICFCLTSLIFWIMYAMTVFAVEVGGFCLAFGYIHYFFILSRLFWLNVLTYEVWYTIGSTNENIRQTASTLSRKMKIYSIYATIAPTVLTILFILAHQRVYIIQEKFVPQMDIFYCWIDVRALDDYYGYLYIYVPTTILIFIITVYYGRIIVYFVHSRNKLRNNANPLYNVNDQLLKTNRKKFIIIVKLGITIAIVWIYYCYSYMTNFDYSSIANNTVFVLSFAHTFEGLYFLIIFAIKWEDIKTDGRSCLCACCQQQI